MNLTLTLLTFATLVSLPASLAFQNSRGRILTAKKAAIGTRLSMQTLNDNNYSELMSSSPLVLVDAMAQWCGPCRLMEPVLENCEKKHGDNVLVAKFDVESGNSNVLIEFLQQDVMPRKLPHLILFKDGKAVGTHNGLIDETKLDAFIESSLSELELLENQVAEETTATKSSSSSPHAESGRLSLTSTSDDYMLSEFN